MSFLQNLPKNSFIQKYGGYPNAKISISFLEILYYLLAVRYFPKSYLNHLNNRILLSLLKLILLISFENIKLNIKVTYLQYPIVLIFNILFLLNKITFLEEIELTDITAWSRGLLILDLAFEYAWRLITLQVFSAGWLTKTAHLLLYSKIFSRVLAPHLYTFGLNSFIFECFVICLPIAFSTLIKDVDPQTDLKGCSMKNSRVLFNFLNSLTEGLVVVNKQEKITFINNYLKSKLNRGDTELSLEELSNKLPSMEFSEVIIQENTCFNFSYKVSESLTKIDSAISLGESSIMLTQEIFK